MDDRRTGKNSFYRLQAPAELMGLLRESREQELRILTSQSTRDLLAANGVETISYRDLATGRLRERPCAVARARARLGLVRREERGAEVDAGLAAAAAGK